MPNIIVFTEERHRLHNYSSFTYIVLHGLYIPRVAQNESFIVKPVYGGTTMMPTRGKILNFGIYESMKLELSRSFYSTKLSLESWMLHYPEAVVHRWPSK